MRVLIAALAISMLPFAAAATEHVRTQRYSLGCTNSSDQQWTETESGLKRLVGAEGRLAFSREESAVAVTGGEGIQHAVAEATRGLPDATCKAVTISYEMFALPEETDQKALLGAIEAAGASNSGPPDLFTVPQNKRDRVVSRIASVPNAEFIAVSKEILNRRSETVQTSHNGLGLSVTLSPMIIEDDVTIDTAMEFTRPAGKGTHRYTNGNRFRMYSGQSELTVVQGPHGVLVTLVTAQVR